MKAVNCLASAIAILGLACPTVSLGEDVSIMVGGIEKQIYLPAMLAQRLGYFEQEGVSVELLSEPAGVEAADEMLAGAVQGVIGFYDHNIDLQSLGKYTESIVQLSQAPGEVEVVSNKHPQVSSVADFKGLSLGITGLGSSTDFLTEYLLIEAGLRLSDITPVPVGAGDSLIAALQHDQIQAAMTTEPTVSRLLATGDARVLIDMRSLAGTSAALGGTYPAACLYMEASWVEGHRDTAQKLANAFVRTLRFIATHSAAEIAALVPEDFYVGDKDRYVKALANSKSMFTPDGLMPKGGPENVLRVLSVIKPSLKARTIDLSKTFTNEFVVNANERN